MISCYFHIARDLFVIVWKLDLHAVVVRAESFERSSVE